MADLGRFRLVALLVPLLVCCGHSPDPTDAPADSLSDGPAPTTPAESAPAFATVKLADEPQTPTLRWLTPADSTIQRQLRPWRHAVGPAVVAPGGWFGEGDGLDSLAIVSWNVHIGGGDVPALVADLRKGALTGGRPVRNFILMLQEAYHTGAPPVDSAARAWAVPTGVQPVPPSGQRTEIAELARDLGLSLVYAPSMRNGWTTGEDRGNAILSTLPLGDALAVELPVEVQRRVALLVRFAGTTSTGKPWRLLVANLHLDNKSTARRGWGVRGGGRARQIQPLLSVLRSDSTLRGPLVLGGDLNSWSPFGEPVLKTLRGRFSEGNPPPKGGGTFAWGLGLSRRVDHLFFRLPDGWGAHYERVDSPYGSDHHPLIGWVRFAAAG